MLRCAQSPRSNVLDKYASARRFFARLASEIFLSSLQTEYFSNLIELNEQSRHRRFPGIFTLAIDASHFF